MWERTLTTLTLSFSLFFAPVWAVPLDAGPVPEGSPSRGLGRDDLRRYWTARKGDSVAQPSVASPDFVVSLLAKARRPASKRRFRVAAPRSVRGREGPRSSVAARGIGLE